ncbi:MAG: type II secretion system protein GspJ [Planctomycetota bacterium]|jgi:type II secretion system protein J
MKENLRKTGFTLVEVMVATTIGTFIALVSIGALRAVTAGAQMVEENIETAAEVRFAARTLRRDLINMYKPSNVQDTKFIAYGDESGLGGSLLTFYTVSRAKARRVEPEGDIYEVEYFLSVEDEESKLMRRFWPNPDDEREPGGILSVIAEDIAIFEARFFDGTEWFSEWPEEMGTFPMLVELNIAAVQEGAKKPAMETIYINLVRSAGNLLEEEEGSGGGDEGESG